MNVIPTEKIPDQPWLPQSDRLYLQAILDHLPALISFSSPSGELSFVSQHHAQLSGVSDQLETVRDIRDLFSEETLAVLNHSNNTGEIVEKELSLKHKNGSVHIYEIKRFELKKDDEVQVCIIGVDVTDHKIAENSLRDHKSQLNYMAFHDPLTGLANRSLFYDRINKSISRAKRSNYSLALMLLDLDRFKNINDSLGHDAGDAYLKHIAQSLIEVLRDTDTVARLGGDEFVVVLENIHRVEDIENIANKILERLARPTKIHGHEISSTASIGISVFPNDGDAIDQLLKHADVAMYKAKGAGKNRFQFFIPAWHESAVNYLLLENDLRRAIEQNELLLHYQPQIDLNTGKIVGLEALVRWQHPERGLVSPLHFIPLAEETGLIEPMGEWVLHHACSQFQKWLESGFNFSKIAVNLSTRQFRQGQFLNIVEKVLQETGLPANYLELEITETSAMEHAAEAVDMLNSLSRMGLSLAIDDFGTGYSSLSYLKRFPIQKLKIDRSFINDIDTDEGVNDAAIAKSIIDLAHNMSLQVIAEGVERSSQSAWLVDRGCDQVQGFYYSKPLNSNQLMELVTSDSAVRDDHGICLKI